MSNLDNQLFLLLNADASPNAAVAWLAIFITRFLVLVIPVYLVGLWVVGGGRNRLTAIALTLALVIAILMSFVIGLVYFHPRPFMAGLGTALVEHRPNSSFPSNHALVFATCAAVLFFLRRRAMAWVAVALGVLVGWSRIYVGVHYPLDMVGSIVVAVLAAMASLWIMDRHGAQLLALAQRTQNLLLARFVRT